MEKRGRGKRVAGHGTGRLFCGDNHPHLLEEMETCLEWSSYTARKC